MIAGSGWTVTIGPGEAETSLLVWWRISTEGKLETFRGTAGTEAAVFEKLEELRRDGISKIVLKAESDREKAQLEKLTHLGYSVTLHREKNPSILAWIVIVLAVLGIILGLITAAGIIPQQLWGISAGPLVASALLQPQLWLTERKENAPEKWTPAKHMAAVALLLLGVGIFLTLVLVLVFEIIK